MAFKALVACGWLSYSDVWVPRWGWQKSILFNAHTPRVFFSAFQTEDHHAALGVMWLSDDGAAENPDSWG